MNIYQVMIILIALSIFTTINLMLLFVILKLVFKQKTFIKTNFNEVDEEIKELIQDYITQTNKLLEEDWEERIETYEKYLKKDADIMIKLSKKLNSILEKITNNYEQIKNNQEVVTKNYKDEILNLQKELNITKNIVAKKKKQIERLKIENTKLKETNG